MVDLIALGEALIDMFPEEMGRQLAEVTAFHPKPGGGPMNVAVAAQRLGLQVAFVGKVGDDAFGHHLLEVLENEGIDTRGARVDDEARTTMAIIAKPDENTAEFIFYRNPGADMLLRPDELDRDLLREARALEFASLSLTNEPIRSATHEAVEVARDAGLMILYDVNYRPALWPSPGAAAEQALAVLPKIDVLKVNEEELALLSGEDVARDEASLGAAAAMLLEKGPALCVVTMGPEGSYFRVAEGGAMVPPFRVKTVDAVGCGDAFTAGILRQLVKEGARWREKLSVETMRGVLRYANAVGALTSTKQGVVPALPTAAAVSAFLEEQGPPQ